jgi:hypothetical protein
MDIDDIIKINRISIFYMKEVLTFENQQLDFNGVTLLFFK